MCWEIDQSNVPMSCASSSSGFASHFAVNDGSQPSPAPRSSSYMLVGYSSSARKEIISFWGLGSWGFENLFSSGSVPTRSKSKCGAAQWVDSLTELKLKLANIWENSLSLFRTLRLIINSSYLNVYFSDVNTPASVKKGATGCSPLLHWIQFRTLFCHPN